MDQSDGCTLCKEGKSELEYISAKLQNETSRPVILQHFPLYRESEMECFSHDGDGPTTSEGLHELFRQGYDCLSEKSSDWIIRKLSPMQVFSGHTHNGCNFVYKELVHEITVPSFSWRNRNNPSFILAKISEDRVYVHKCFLPEESTVINIYIFSVLLSLIL